MIVLLLWPECPLGVLLAVTFNNIYEQKAALVIVVRHYSNNCWKWLQVHLFVELSSEALFSDISKKKTHL